MKKIFIVLALLFFNMFAMNSFAIAEDSLVIAIRQEPSSLDPTLQWDEYSVTVCGNIYSTLCRYNSLGKLVPDLAVSWKNIADDIVQVKLREGVSFHNGEPFDAVAVKYTIERELDETIACPRRSVISSQIKSVEIVDDYTINIITQGSRPMTMPWLTTVHIVPPVYTQNSSLEDYPIGTGPYKYVSASKTKDVIVLVSYDNYYGDKPDSKHVVYKVVADAGERVKMLLEGKADVITDVKQLSSMKVQQQENVKIIKKPGGLIMYIQIQTEGDTPLSNRKVRQALNYAIDKKALIRYMKHGNGQASAQPTGIGCFGYNQKLLPYTYDPQKAKELLAEAGYADGFDITIWGPTHYDGGEKFPQAIRKYLEEIGLSVNLEYKRKELQPGETISGWKDNLNKTSSHQIPPSTLRIAGWGFDIMDASNIMDEYLISESKSCYFHNKELNDLLTIAKGEIISEEREKLLMQANKIAHDEAVFIYLWDEVSIYGATKDIDFAPHPAGFVFAYDVFLE